MNNLGHRIYEDVELLPIDIGGWNGNNGIFEDIITSVNPKTIIEVGTWKGQSAITMANCLRSKNINCKIYCVDTWLGATEFWTDLKDTKERDLMLKNGYPQIYNVFLSNVIQMGLTDYIIPVPNTSQNAARIFSYYKIKADICYIDASHEEEDVFNDIISYEKLITNNGVLFGDDYGLPGVKKAVDRRFGHEIKIENNNYWIWR